MKISQFGTKLLATLTPFRWRARKSTLRSGYRAAKRRAFFESLEERRLLTASPDFLLNWEMDATLGTVEPNLGTLGAAANGNLLDGPTLGVEGAFGPGSRAIQFDLGPDHVQTATATPLPQSALADNTYTVSAWVKVNAFNGERGDVVSIVSATNGHGILIEIGANGTLRYLHRPSNEIFGGTDIFAAGVVNVGQWHQVAAVMDNGAMSLYVDGILQGTASNTSPISADSHVIVGKLKPSPDSSRHFDGAIDDVRISNSALTAAQIGNLVVANKAPEGTDNTLTTEEDSTLEFTSANFGFSDPLDTPTNNFTGVTITALPVAGTLKLGGVALSAGGYVTKTQIDAAQLTFDPAANGNGAPYTSFTFRVEDDGGTANGGVNLDPTPNTITINVNSVDDAPVLTGGSVPVTYVEDAPAQPVDPNLTVTDVDAGATLNGASAIITGNFVPGQDLLVFANQNGISGSYNSSNGVLTLTGITSVANYQAALRSFAIAIPARLRTPRRGP